MSVRLVGVAMARQLGFKACPDSFPSCESDPDPKSGQDLDPDKPVWFTFCGKM